MFPCPQLTVLLLAASAAASPIEILKVEDAEAGYGHQQSGVPGQEVEGSFYWKVRTSLPGKCYYHQPLPPGARG